jgi:ElaB/YqjD/DUF883 family membrane-anchored ribosome-binding protein
MDAVRRVRQDPWSVAAGVIAAVPLVVGLLLML